MGCQACRGMGVEPVYRCPRYYSRTPGITATLSAWSYLKAHGILPVSGGSMEQTACFHSAAQILNSAQGAHQNRDSKRA